MLITSLLSTTCLLALLAFLYSIFKRVWRYIQLTKNIPSPGPLLLGIIAVAKENKFDPVKITGAFSSNFQLPEGIFKFWRGIDLFVNISDPNHAQIYCNDPALTKRSDIYDTFDTWLGPDNILSAHYQPWKRLRKILVHSFNGLSQNDLASTMFQEANKLVKTIEKSHENIWTHGERLIGESTNSLFTRVTFDEDIVEYPSLIESLLQTYDLLKTVILRIVSPVHFLNLFFPLTKEARRYKVLTKIIRDETRKIIDKKKIEYDELILQGKTPPNTYANIIFEKYSSISLDEVTNQLVTMYAAGVDTSITGITFILTMLGVHKDVQERIFEEDKEVQARLAGGQMEANDFAEYVYLEQVIKETLRLYPVFPMISRVAQKDVQMGKYVVPEGATVLWNMYWTHRRADIFRDPLKFDPDRHSPENSKGMHPYALSPFSSGPKTCIGNKFAMMTLKAYIITLVRNYKIYSKYTSVEELDKNVTATVTLHDENKCPIRFERRV